MSARERADQRPSWCPKAMVEVSGRSEKNTNRIPGYRFRVECSGFRLHGFGFEVSGFGLRVETSGFKVQS